jgi:hypothetical protein
MEIKWKLKFLPITILSLFLSYSLNAQKIEYFFCLQNDNLNSSKMEYTLSDLDKYKPNTYLYGYSKTKENNFDFEFISGIKFKNDEFSVGISTNTFKQITSGSGLEQSDLYFRYNEGNNTRSYDFKKLSLYYCRFIPMSKLDIGLGLFAKSSYKKAIVEFAGTGTSYNKVDKSELYSTRWDSITSPNVFNYCIGINPSIRIKLASFLKISSGIFTGFNLETRKGYYIDIARQYVDGFSVYPVNRKEYFNTKAYTFYYQPYLSLQFIFK